MDHRQLGPRVITDVVAECSCRYHTCYSFANEENTQDCALVFFGSCILEHHDTWGAPHTIAKLQQNNTTN